MLQKLIRRYVEAYMKSYKPKNSFSLLNDKEIRRLAIQENMIENFADRQMSGSGIISFGLSSYGYDVRCNNQFKIFTNINSTIIDPKDFNSASYIDYEGDVCIIPPHSFILTRTVEYFRMPKDVLAIALGKSTLARSALVLNVTPIEPGFEGTITIEIANTSSLPVKLYANEGCCQLIFFRGDTCEVTYKDRAGKYQGQIDIQPPLVIK